mmetsp:Transcript_99284/g.227949  ORF Transcript_99284/g.227949 Transcript_99284/m.227949 type:complete len:82 (-) Transcript_99284:37-282(-)
MARLKAQRARLRDEIAGLERRVEETRSKAQEVAPAKPSPHAAECAELREELARLQRIREDLEVAALQGSVAAGSLAMQQVS